MNEINSLYSELPDTHEYQYILKKNYPLLVGTKKQVEFADDIRDGIRKGLLSYAKFVTSDGRPSTLFSVAKCGKTEVIRNIERSVSCIYDETVKTERIKSAVNAYKDLAKRIKRYNEIMGHESAAFWIDNRPTYTENYRNEKFKKFIDD